MMEQRLILEGRTKVFWGNGVMEEALKKTLDEMGAQAVMVVTTGGALIRNGYLEQLEGILHESAIKQCVIYDSVGREPKLEEIMEAICMGIENRVELVIGFGGGSAIDAAKAVAVGIGENADLHRMEDFLLKGEVPKEKTKPIIAIPTTAGTGSELSKAAILISEAHGVKSGIRGEYVLPAVSIVDPVFTWSVPETITMETGFDVLAHAIESYVSKQANIFSEMLSEKAIEIVGRCLPELKHNLDNHKAREEMSFASMIMGINLAKVGTAIPHRLQYPVGVRTQTSHGAGLAAVYPAWMAKEYEVNAGKVQKIGSLLGLRLDDNVECVFREFQRQLGIAYSLSAFGIKADEVDILVSQVSGNLYNDKLYQGRETLHEIMMESMEN